MQLKLGITQYVTVIIVDPLHMKRALSWQKIMV